VFVDEFGDDLLFVLVELFSLLGAEPLLLLDVVDVELVEFVDVLASAAADEFRIEDGMSD
jgi:hypothetical protein